MIFRLKMRRSKAERQAHIEAWRMSGLSKPAYCREHQLKYPTFMSWFTQDLKEEAINTGEFIEIDPSNSTTDLTEVIFPNGIRIHYRGFLTNEQIQMLYNA